MKLYTKTGDGGETGLGDGSRVRKDHPRVAAGGAVDTLSSFVGAARAACEDEGLAAQLERVQRELFVAGSDLATPGPDQPASKKPTAPRITADLVANLEQWIDQASAQVSPLKSFILPGGCELASRLHLARATCREAERQVVALSGQERVNKQVLVYLNRLGDLLFAWARLANAQAGAEDAICKPE
jgi:cob(I)alamin adenosyltransferase